MLKGVKRYAKKILYWFMFFVTAVALYIIIRNQQRSSTGIDTDFGNLHRTDKRIKEYLDTSESNIRAATADNSEALDLVSRFEKTNERFRRLLQEIQKGTKD